VNRLGKSVVLTDTGKKFIVYINNILNEVEEAPYAVKQYGEITGTLIISADETLCIYRTFFEWSLSQKGMSGITEFVFYSNEAIKKCTKLEMGIVILPEMAVTEELNRGGGLVKLPWV